MHFAKICNWRVYEFIREYIDALPWTKKKSHGYTNSILGCKFIY